MGNRECRVKLKILYGCRCLLTGLKTESKKNQTLHHIVKKESGGKTTVENGAILIDKIHRWLHSLEHSDTELYKLVNECIELYKKCLDKEEKELMDQWKKEVQPLFRERMRDVKYISFKKVLKGGNNER